MASHRVVSETSVQVSLRNAASIVDLPAQVEPGTPGRAGTCVSPLRRGLSFPDRGSWGGGYGGGVRG
jgi:hypothetical protein